MRDRLADRVEAATSPHRDRYVDFLRVSALVAVVVGHWLIPVFEPVDGTYAVRFIMTEQPWTQWATWLFQVMPVFFIVGGYAGAVAWTRARERGERPEAWASARARRLLRPLLPLLVLWVGLVVLGDAFGVEGRYLTLASQSALVASWFIAVYVVVTVAVPVTLRLDARVGLWLPVALVALVAVADALAAAGLDEAQWTSFLWVWFAVHQLGIVWHRRGLPTPAQGALLLLAGLAALGALVGLAGYPVDMVAEVDGATNATPPSLAMPALATAQLGLIALLRAPLERALSRPGIWALVALAGSRIMTVFLWHMTALVAVAVGLDAAGALPLAAALGWGWWVSRPVWLALCAAALAVLVVVAGRAERPPRLTPARVPRPVAVAVGALGVAVALGTLAAGGVHDPEGPLGLAAWPLAGLVAALALLGVLSPARRGEGGVGAR